MPEKESCYNCHYKVVAHNSFPCLDCSKIHTPPVNHWKPVEKPNMKNFAGLKLPEETKKI